MITMMLTVSAEGVAKSNMLLYVFCALLVLTWIGIAVVAVLLARAARKKNERYDDAIALLEEQLNTAADEQERLNQRIAMLESQQQQAQKALQEQLMKVEKAQEARVVSPATTSPSQPSVVFFRTPVPVNMGIFTEQDKKRDERSRFRATVKDNEATFEPIDFETLRYNDSMFYVVDDAPDSVSHQAARSMVVLSPGKAVWQNDRWNVVEKCIIKFS